MDDMKRAIKKPNTVRIYRGLTQAYDPDYKLEISDAPHGYSTWTDNEDLAREYAGPSGHVYHLDLPQESIGASPINEDSGSNSFGDRYLAYSHDKPAGLNNISGREYLLYHGHDLFDHKKISKATKTPSKFTGYKRLEQIKRDHGVMASGNEHHQDDLDQAIVEAKMRDADKMVQQANKRQGGTLKKGKMGDWRQEGYRFEHKEGVNPNTKMPYLQVHAYAPNGEKVGYAAFEESGNDWEPQWVNVATSHQRKGLASAMYQHAEQKTGRNVVPSQSQTTEGKKFSDARQRSFKKSQLIKDAPKLRLPNVKDVMSRPEQNIHQVPSYNTDSRKQTRSMQAKIAANKMTQPFKETAHADQYASHKRQQSANRAKNIEDVAQYGEGLGHGDVGGFVIRQPGMPQHAVGFAAQDHDENRGITEHEAAHLMLTDVEAKYGKDARNKVVSHFLSHFHPDDIKSIKHVLDKTGAYKDSPRFNEELANTLRDVVANKQTRESIVPRAWGAEGLPIDMNRIKAGLKNATKSLASKDADWLLAGQDMNHMREMQENTNRASQLRSTAAPFVREAHGHGKLAAGEMEKSRGRLTFPKFKRINNRPDQQIQSVDNDRQADIYARKTLNAVDINQFYSNPNMPKYKQRIMQENNRNKHVKDLGHSIKTQMSPSDHEKTLKYFSRKGKVIPPEVVSHFGQVSYGNEGAQHHGMVSGEGQHYTGHRREHEAIHYTLRDMHQKYGPEVADQVSGHLEKIIHPDVHGVLNDYLQNTGYSDTKNEIVTHLYELLHDPKTRESVRQFSPDFANNERDIMGKAKRSWDAVRHYAKNLKEPS